MIIGAILIPPAVRAASDLVADAPEYAQDVEDAFQENDTLRGLNEDFDLSQKIQDAADDAQAGALSDAGVVLTDVGGFLVKGIFALVTVLVLSMFLVARGGNWVEAFLEDATGEGGGRAQAGAATRWPMRSPATSPERCCRLSSPAPRRSSCSRSSACPRPWPARS